MISLTCALFVLVGRVALHFILTKRLMFFFLLLHARGVYYIKGSSYCCRE